VGPRVWHAVMIWGLSSDDARDDSSDFCFNLRIRHGTDDGSDSVL